MYSKITLIKSLRDKVRDSKSKISTNTESDGTFSLTVIPTNLDLRFCKEFVESCMAFGVEEFKKDNNK